MVKVVISFIAQTFQYSSEFQELGKREDIILKKEAMMNEKSELEMKKLRSSQVLSKVVSVVGCITSKQISF